MPPVLLVLTGPTATGKTGLAVQLAKRLETEIVSADSRQFFREMSIGTAKPDIAELEQAPHHFINNISIHDKYDAGKFEEQALACLDTLFAKHPVVILCGGSGMYIDAVCVGFDPLPDTGEEHRRSLNALFETKGIAALQELLGKHDPEHYKMVDLQNPQRLIRALEICLATGKPYSGFRSGKKKTRPFQIVKVGLNMHRDALYKRIDARVDLMMEKGLLKEVSSLQTFRELNALQTVGYRELFGYLDGQYGLLEAIELIKQNTRRFAKRQMTWFRKDEHIHWIDPTTTLNAVEEICQLIQGKGSRV
jgi:tRNA dimethylallyltransferase